MLFSRYRHSFRHDYNTITAGGGIYHASSFSAATSHHEDFPNTFCGVVCSFVLNSNDLINENFIFFYLASIKKNSISYKWNCISNSTFNHKQSIRSTGSPEQPTFHSVNKPQRGENHISRSHDLFSQFYNRRKRDLMFVFYFHVHFPFWFHGWWN